MKKLILSSIVIFLPALAFADTTSTGTIVEGGLDIFECIVSAGYSGNTANNTCIRPWEQRSIGSGQIIIPILPPRNGTGEVNPPPRDASGSMMPPPPKNGLGIDTKVLEMAMQSLSETDKAELEKTIRSFFESKGIKLPTPEEMQAKKGEIQQQRQEIKKEIQQTRQIIQSARQNIKQARQNLREKKTPPPKNETASGTVAQ